MPKGNHHDNEISEHAWSASPSAIAKHVRGFSYALAILVLLAFLSTQIFAAPVTVTLNTSSLSGTNSQLAFDLVDGDGVINNSVSISSFATDGTLGSSTSLGGVAGTLPGPVTISDSDFFNELLQGITLGNALSFVLDFTNNFAGGATPDAFAFFILDDSGTTSLVTTNLLGNALLTGDYTGSGALALTAAGSTAPLVDISIAVASVPEPSPLLLLLIAGIAAFIVKGQG